MKPDGSHVRSTWEVIPDECVHCEESVSKKQTHNTAFVLSLLLFSSELLSNSDVTHSLPVVSDSRHTEHVT